MKKQMISFNSINDSLRFDAQHETDEWMEKLFRSESAPNGRDITFYTEGEISEQEQMSIRSFRGVKQAVFNQ